VHGDETHERALHVKPNVHTALRCILAHASIDNRCIVLSYHCALQEALYVGGVARVPRNERNDEPNTTRHGQETRL
jgi:hypothetical protein